MLAYAGRTSSPKGDRCWAADRRTSTRSRAACVRAPPADAGRTTVDRAVGLLAGRTRCRLSDAHRHLLRMAHEQDRDLVDAAAGVIGMLDVPDPPAGRRRRRRCRRCRTGCRSARFEPWLATVQKILDAMPGAGRAAQPGP